MRRLGEEAAEAQLAEAQLTEAWLITELETGEIGRERVVEWCAELLNAGGVVAALQMTAVWRDERFRAECGEARSRTVVFVQCMKIRVLAGQYAIGYIRQIRDRPHQQPCHCYRGQRARVDCCDQGGERSGADHGGDGRHHRGGVSQWVGPES